MGIVAHGIGCDPKQRYDHHHGDVVGPLTGDAALDLDFPDVVEGAFDRREYADHGPEKRRQRDGRHDAALRASQGFFSERDQVVYDIGILRKDSAKALHQVVGHAETFQYGEYDGDDRYERHKRVERQCCAVHDRAVFEQPACRIEKQPVLLDEPPQHGIFPFAQVAAENRVREICRNLAEFHGDRTVGAKIMQYPLFSSFGGAIRR